MKTKQRARRSVFVEAAEEHDITNHTFSCWSLRIAGATKLEEAAYVALFDEKQKGVFSDKPSIRLCGQFTAACRGEHDARRNHCVFALLFAEEFFRGVDLSDFIAEAETYPPTSTVPLEQAGIIPEGEEAVPSATRTTTH